MILSSRHHGRRDGFTIMEIILAISVLLVALLSLMSVFSGGARHAVMTRNRTAAMLMAQSLMEELQGHTYGAPAPSTWPVDTEKPESFEVWVEGKRQLMDFRRKLVFANGTAIGKGGTGNYDVATITVSWEEYDPVAKGGKREQKTVTATLSLWRQGGVQ